MSRRVAFITAVAPALGCVLLAALAIAHERAFEAIVREDSVLEWAEVCAYAAAAVASARVALRTRGLVRFAYGLLAAAAAIGEELSWGQRLFDLTTPEPLAAANRQQELNVHNLADAESTTRLVLLAAASYGATLPLLRRPGPFDHHERSFPRSRLSPPTSASDSRFSSDRRTRRRSSANGRSSVSRPRSR